MRAIKLPIFLSQQVLSLRKIPGTGVAIEIKARTFTVSMIVFGP